MGHIPRRLQRRVRQHPMTLPLIRISPRSLPPVPHQVTRTDTWINADIRQLYIALHKMGFAHSVEVWYEGNLAGGLYGVRLRAAFFGESMFSRRTNASKIALVHLMARLRHGGFRLLMPNLSMNISNNLVLSTSHVLNFSVMPRDALANESRPQPCCTKLPMVTAMLAAG